MIAPVVFRYWPRKGGEPILDAKVGTTISLEERRDYVISLRRNLSSAEQQRLSDLGGELLSPDTAVLGFGNFVGRTEFAGVGIHVTSTKVGEDGVSRVLEEVSELAAGLIFGSKSPTGFAAVADRKRHAPVPYHQLQFLRGCMISARPGNRVQDWVAAIERNATRRFEPERPVVLPSRVKRLDQRAMRTIFSRIDRLVPIQPDQGLALGPLSTELTFGTPPRPHFPEKIAAPRGKLSFDTPENRFLKHVLTECLSLVYRFVEHPRIHKSFKADCRTMVAYLEQYSTLPFIAEAGHLSSFLSPSQALLKADGYREIFSFWGDLTRHVSLPSTAEETNRLLEGRDMATLYEYWVFLKVLESTIKATGLASTGRLEIIRDDLGETLRLGLGTSLGSQAVVRFNPTFTHSNATAYSTPLRPDVTVELNGILYAFDAKYRLDRLNADEDDPDDDPATYKRADLYKMHTYRDAIRTMKAAFVVYPGTEFVFFERAGNKRLTPTDIVAADGVGAIPLKPNESVPADCLTTLIEVLFRQSVPPRQSAVPR